MQITAPGVGIIRVAAAPLLVEVKKLLLEYAGSLEIDLGFQDFKRELAGLPGPWAPPTGTLLLAQVGSRAAGCVGLKCWRQDVAEMKRLYVRPQFRGGGIGKALVMATVQEACARGYRRLRLDTLPSMAAARGLYASLGFKEIPRTDSIPWAGPPSWNSTWAQLLK